MNANSEIPQQINDVDDPGSSVQDGSSANGSGTGEKSDTPLTQRRSPPVHEWTYFIRDAEGIKIGRSISPRARMHDLQAGNGSRLELLVAVSEKRLTEAAAHRQFAHLRTHREWFRPEQDLLDFIEALKSEMRKPKRACRGNPIVSKLQALRKAHGAATAIGHCCSTLMEQIPAMEGYVRPAWAQDRRQTLPYKIEWQMKRLEALKAALTN